MHLQKKRRVRNRLSGLYGPNDSWVESTKEMEDVTTNYFNELFREADTGDISEVIRELTQLITEEMNKDLIKDITEVEVKTFLFSMNPEEAPGPDGMMALFNQQFWHSIKDYLVSLIRDFFRSNRFDEWFNETNIFLILNTGKPKRMTELRPISLCNVSYKIVSKIRLEKVLPR